MQHGRGMWVWLWLLLVALPLRADEISQQEYQQVTQDITPALKSLKTLYRESDIAQLNYQLADFSVLEQEALRSALVDYAHTLKKLDDEKIRLA
ncbi:hypothetical protein [Photobacterium arenosum]|uniref:hypothetical protein n=1 Tax=Photobacterium arenosum TaxID=2774143 RepID=UPI002889315D|nr:hypothetical protein [Photobacterium arenosum]